MGFSTHAGLHGELADTMMESCVGCVYIRQACYNNRQPDWAALAAAAHNFAIGKHPLSGECIIELA